MTESHPLSDDWTGGLDHWTRLDWTGEMDSTTRVEYMTLPPYNPEASGRAPSDRPMTSEELISRYKISKSQWHNRKNALPHIQGFTKDRKKLFTPEEIFQMDAVDYYITSGFSLDDLTDAYMDADPISNNDPIDVQPLNPTTTPSELTLAVTPQVEAMSQKFGQMVEAIERFSRPDRDPLRSLRYLKEAHEENYPLTAKMLAEILELKLTTIHSFKSGEERHGYTLIKMGAGKWRVEKSAPEAKAA